MVTIVDVARRAAVTAATVSNVVTGKGSVSAETRARVLAAIDELGYRPNLVARGLKRRRSLTLALVLPTIANPFYPEIAQEVERIAREHGYHLLLCHTHNDPTIGQEHLDGLLGRMVDGLLVMGGSLELSAVLTTARRGLPVVLSVWTEEQRDLPLPVVDVDFRCGGELAARHLTELGHRRAAVIVQPHTHVHRLEGFRAEMASRRIALPGTYVRHGDSTMESGYRATAALLALPARPTAIFATNDLMALGAMEAAADHGLRVPTDLSIIGLDDIMLSAHARPPLTTIAIPKRVLATEATELLLHLVKGASPSPTVRAVRPHLVIRDSTAAPREVPAAPSRRSVGKEVPV